MLAILNSEVKAGFSCKRKGLKGGWGGRMPEQATFPLAAFVSHFQTGNNPLNKGAYSH